MNRSYWSMLKENFDSPGELIPLGAFFVSCVFLWYGKLSATEWLGALGLCITAHTLNHAADPNPPK